MQRMQARCTTPTVATSAPKEGGQGRRGGGAIALDDLFKGQGALLRGGGWVGLINHSTQNPPTHPPTPNPPPPQKQKQAGPSPPPTRGCTSSPPSTPTPPPPPPPSSSPPRRCSRRWLPAGSGWPGRPRRMWRGRSARRPSGWRRRRGGRRRWVDGCFLLIGFVHGLCCGGSIHMYTYKCITNKRWPAWMCCWPRRPDERRRRWRRSCDGRSGRGRRSTGERMGFGGGRVCV